MQNTLLWQAFATLTHLERKHADQWLASVFFNRREQPRLLFNYLNTCIEKKKLPVQEEAVCFVFKQSETPLYKRKKVESEAATAATEQAFRLLCSELLGQIEHFLAYNHWQQEPARQHLHLAAAYRKKGLEKQFKQTLLSTRKIWDKRPYRDAAYYDAQMQLEYELYQSLSSGRRTESLNLRELSTATDTAFLARKLTQACFALSHQAVYKADYDFGLLHVLLEHIRQSPPLLDIPAIALYYYCYLFLSDPAADADFQTFKTLLFEYQAQLPPEEQRNLHLLALNFCIKKINLLQTPYFREALELYQSALRGGLLLDQGQLSHFAFNNIVAIALHINETTWATSFIHDYAPFLEKKHREATFHLNLARVDYVRKEYRNALLNLQQADYKDLINNLIAKTLQLKIYYETDELDALDAHLQSMESFIRRQKDIGYHRTNYLNIVRYMKKIVRHNPNERAERDSLRSQIELESQLTEKDWLLEQLR